MGYGPIRLHWANVLPQPLPWRLLRQFCWQQRSIVDCRRLVPCASSSCPISPSSLLISVYFGQKNVYSVFRYSPPAVGFAQLSSTATSMSNGNLAVPEATIGSIIASTTASVTVDSKNSSAVARMALDGSAILWSLVSSMLITWAIFF
jgi:hypothetical protein